MTAIPEATKAELKRSGVQFNRVVESETVINGGLLDVTKRAVGNAIEDDKPYTIRINFRNGRIVGSEANPRLSVELLDGRASTTQIDVAGTSNVVFIEFKHLQIDGFPTIVNGDSWVARARIYGDSVKSAFVNRDFSEEDREIIEKTLLRGFRPPVRM